MDETSYSEIGLKRQILGEETWKYEKIESIQIQKYFETTFLANPEICSKPKAEIAMQCFGLVL